MAKSKDVRGGTHSHSPLPQALTADCGPWALLSAAATMRDRLAQMRGAQQGALDDPDGGHQSIEMDPLLSQENWNSIDEFLTRCTNASQELKQLEGYLARIQRIHHTILSQPGSDKELGAELRNLYSLFSKESRALREVVQNLGKEVNGPPKTLSAPSEDVSSVNQRIKKDQVRSLSTGLINIITKFNTEQEDYKQKHLQEITRYMKIQDHDITESEVMSAIENGEIDNLTKGLMLAVADKKALFQEVQSRHGEILSLEKSMRELHELFHDLYLLVQSQGEMIDNIEKNVQNAVEYADRAKSNVEGARTAQKRARKMKILICVGLVVLAIFLFFVLQGLVCHFTPIC